MKPPELFGVIVRVIGLIMTIYGVWQIPLALLNIFIRSQQAIRVTAEGPMNVAALFSGILALLVGLWFLGGSKSLIAHAYPENQGTDTEQRD